ncbi:Ig-like domain-containing protein [Archangium violaceum]|uniref:Ig-like domain-containing protein n=1 Tax=Archangium violaceum TaxID=83451 RepID=UPI0037BF07CB
MSGLALFSGASRRPGWAGVFAGLCVLTRNQGAFVVAATALLAASREEGGARRLRALLIVGALGALGALSFLAFEYLASGSPLAFLQAQSGWHRADSVAAVFKTFVFGNPWQSTRSPYLSTRVNRSCPEERTGSEQGTPQVLEIPEVRRWHCGCSRPAQDREVLFLIRKQRMHTLSIRHRLTGLLVLSLLAACNAPLEEREEGLPTSTGTSALAPANFLYRQGKQLYLNGAPYQMVGVNAFPLTGCGAAPNDAQLDAFFAGLRPNGLTRAWAFKPQGLANLERVVAAAEKYNQKLILTLADGRSYCGEWDGYNGSDGSGKQNSWYSSGYKTHYVPWVKQVVTRFANSPAVGMWELINEPDDAGNLTTLKAFFNDVSTIIKQIDPNHLISSGSWAPWAYGGQSGFQFIHDVPNVDVGSLHEYDYDYNNGNTIVSPHFAPAINAMNALNKPLIVGETGINAADSGCRTNRTQRRDAMRQKFQQYLAGGAAGVFVWTWQATNVTGCELNFGPNDPMLPMIRDYPLASVPPPPTGDSVQLNDGVVGTGQEQFEYTGTWEAGTGTGKFQSDDHFSNTTGSSYVVRFSGTQAKLYGSVASHHGIASVSVDNGTAVDVDFYSATRQEQKLLWTSPVLSAGSHTLKVTVSGRKNASSSGYVITADRVDLTRATQGGDTTAPSVSITQPTGGTVAVGSVTVQASASDNVGVAKVELWVDGAKLAEDDSSPYSFTWSATAGQHALVAKAVDAAGNVGTSATVTVTASAQTVVVQLNDGVVGTGQEQFEYTGTWEAGTGTGKFQSDDHFSNTTGSSYVVRFSGTQAKLYGSVASHHGIASVSVDNGAAVDVDFYSATRQEQKLLWTSPVLSAGSHTLKVIVSGRKNASSSGYVITADRVDLTALR